MNNTISRINLRLKFLLAVVLLCAGLCACSEEKKQVSDIPEGCLSCLDGVVYLGQYKGVTYVPVAGADNEQSVEEARREVMGKIAETSRINRNLDEEIAEYRKNSKEFFEKIAVEFYGITAPEYFERFYGVSPEEYDNYLDSLAENAVREQYILSAVVEAEQLTLSEQEYQSGLEAYRQRYNISSDYELEELIGGDDTIREALLLEKAQNLIFAYAVPLLDR